MKLEDLISWAYKMRDKHGDIDVWNHDDGIVTSDGDEFSPPNAEPGVACTQECFNEMFFDECRIADVLAYDAQLQLVRAFLTDVGFECRDDENLATLLAALRSGIRDEDFSWEDISIALFNS